MTIPQIRPAGLLLLSLGLLSHAPASAAAPVSPSVAVVTEVDAVDQAFVAEKGGHSQIADTHLAAPGRSEWASDSVSVLLARRTAAVCALLRNAGDYERAEQLATRIIRQISPLGERNDAEHAERLFWEAWMESDVLGHRERALTLLKTAEKLAPTDERIIELELRLISAATPWPDTGATP